MARFLEQSRVFKLGQNDMNSFYRFSAVFGLALGLAGCVAVEESPTGEQSRQTAASGDTHGGFLSKLPYSGLHNCDERSAPSLACNAAANLHCISLPGSPRGYGPVDSVDAEGSAQASVFCAKSVRSYRTSLTELGSAHSECNATAKAFNLVCTNAVHRFCRTKGARSGYLNRVEGGHWFAHCLQPQSASLVAATFAQLATFDPQCDDRLDMPTMACRSAVHQLCASHGFVSGYGPVASGQVACIHHSGPAAAPANHSVPSTLEPGAEVTVSVTMRNTGSTTWRHADRIKLGWSDGVHVSDAYLPWNTTNRRVALNSGEQVQPGETKRFEFSITAPMGPGTYTLQRRMIDELPGAGWFGQPTARLMIRVGAAQYNLGPETITTADGALPALPALAIRVVNFDTDGKRSSSVLSTERHNSDMRLAANMSALNTMFFLARRPEAFSQPFDEVTVNGHSNGLHVPISELVSPQWADKMQVNATAICDGTNTDLDGENVLRRNPYSCQDAPDHDCYDVTLVNGIVDGGPAKLMGLPLTIKVRQPKTASAEVVAVVKRGAGKVVSLTMQDYGPGGVALAPRPIPHALGLRNISMDGRVITIGAAPPTGLIYNVSPSGASFAPCDVAGWATQPFRRITEAHQDPRMAAYGLGKYPIRDMHNKILTKMDYLSANYHWLDSHANNVFFVAAKSAPHYVDSGSGQVRSRFPGLAPVPGTDGVPNPTNAQQIKQLYDTNVRVGQAFFGSWSQGKVVAMDFPVSNIDFGLFHQRSKWRAARLYRGGTQGVVTIGASRHAFNTCLDNKFNFNPNLRPRRKPRDVVWLCSEMDGSGEFAFDDYLSNTGFIISNMTSTVNVSDKVVQPALGDMLNRFNDGFVYDGDLSGRPNQTLPKVDNSATAVSPPVVAQAPGLAGRARWSGRLMAGSSVGRASNRLLPAVWSRATRVCSWTVSTTASCTILGRSPHPFARHRGFSHCG